MKRQKAREQAFLLIFEQNFKDETLEEIIDLAKVARNIQIYEFAEDLFYGVNEHIEDIDKLIEENIKGWKKDRISKVSLSALRIAVYEMLYREDIPISVSINEAVNLVKTYSVKDEASFVNGILGSISKEIEGKNV